MPASSDASPRWPQLIPLAQLVAVVLGVFAIIWNQQQTTDNLRTELRADIIRLETELRAEISNEIDGLRTEMGELRSEISNEIDGLRTEMGELRAEISNEIDGLRTEMGELRAEIGELRVLVVENGQRLARIEGFLGIGIPDSAPQGDDRAAGDDRGPGG
ncbi:MAG: DUF1640 domain-containing protein [Acidimicrobiaceae bacterium]|nr:DUF1640 domain-containing protein [Acidimicrobiaceae bacterium]